LSSVETGSRSAQPVSREQWPCNEMPHDSPPSYRSALTDQDRLCRHAMARDTTDSRLGVGQIRHAAKVGVDAVDHLEHRARSGLVRLVVARPLTRNVTEAAAHAESMAEPVVHDFDEASCWNALQHSDILKDAFRRRTLASGNALKECGHRALAKRAKCID